MIKKINLVLVVVMINLYQIVMKVVELDNHVIIVFNMITMMMITIIIIRVINMVMIFYYIVIRLICNIIHQMVTMTLVKMNYDELNLKEEEMVLVKVNRIFVYLLVKRVNFMVSIKVKNEILIKLYVVQVVIMNIVYVFEIEQKVL